jgi:hypothetical protein
MTFRPQNPAGLSWITVSTILLAKAQYRKRGDSGYSIPAITSSIDTVAKVVA